MTKADLTKAYLTKANLSEADLKETHLEEAKNLTAEQVRSAKNWREAYLPDYLKHLPTHIPPRAPDPRVLRPIKSYYVHHLFTEALRMNDPHVVALFYNVKHSAAVDYSEAKPLEHKEEKFKITIANDKACFTMKAHYATEEKALAAVEEYIQAWELDAALQAGPNAFTLEF